MKNWYLISSPSLSSGGFENDAFNDYKNDTIIEALNTDLASTVLLCNHDLSKKKKIRAIIQDNVANTQLKSMERSILVPIGTLRAGDYIFFENEYWLVNGRPGNNKVYEKAVIIECQYLLKWQNSAGRIIERWANLVSASKYDVGENGNHVIFLTSNNYTILVPQDEETFELDGKRVFIDLNKRNPRKVFKITRDDDVLYNYNSRGGVLSLIADKTEINLDTDNTELMICDYFPVNHVLDEDEIESLNQSQVSLKIIYKGSNSLIAGGNYKEFTLCAYDECGKEIPIDNNVSWSVTTLENNQDYISYEILDEKSIKIKAQYNESIIGSQVLVVASVFGKKESIFLDIGGGI